MRSREKFDESVGTVDKGQSSSDKISGNAGISANSRADLAEPGSLQAAPFRVSDRMIDRRRIWQIYDLASNHTPILAKGASMSRSLLVLGRGGASPMSGVSSGFAFPEFGITLA